MSDYLFGALAGAVVAVLLTLTGVAIYREATRPVLYTVFLIEDAQACCTEVDRAYAVHDLNCLGANGGFVIRHATNYVNSGRPCGQ